MGWAASGVHDVAVKPDMPVFTGAELALADSLVLVIDVLMLHGVMKSDAIDSVFGYLEERYRENGLTSSAAMAHYLRQHLSRPQEAGARVRLRSLLSDPTDGNA
jgi:hypothetical protein